MIGRQRQRSQSRRPQSRRPSRQPRPRAHRVRTQQVAARQRQRRHRRPRPVPETPLTRNQQVVAARLAQGRVDLVTLSSWSFVTPFLAFLEEIRFLALLDLPGQGFCRVMIPVARLLLTE